MLLFSSQLKSHYVGGIQQGDFIYVWTMKELRKLRKSGSILGQGQGQVLPIVRTTPLPHLDTHTIFFFPMFAKSFSVSGKKSKAYYLFLG